MTNLSMVLPQEGSDRTIVVRNARGARRMARTWWREMYALAREHGWEPQGTYFTDSYDSEDPVGEFNCGSDDYEFEDTYAKAEDVEAMASALRRAGRPDAEELAGFLGGGGWLLIVGF